VLFRSHCSEVHMRSRIAAIAISAMIAAPVFAQTQSQTPQSTPQQPQT